MRNLEGKFNRNINEQIRDTETKFLNKFEKINKISQAMQSDLKAKVEISNENLTKNVILPFEKSLRNEIVALKDNFESKCIERVNFIDERLKLSSQLIDIFTQNNKLQLEKMERIEKTQHAHSKNIDEISNELQAINENAGDGLVV